MHGRSLALVRLGLAAVFLAVSAGAFAQSYGLTDQVLFLGHAAFRGQDSGVAYHMGADAYLYGNSGNAAFLGTFQLPEGARVTQMCVYANVGDAADYVQVQLDESRLLAGGQNPPQWSSQGSATDDVAIGYGVVCTDMSYEFHNFVNGYNVAHDLFAETHGASGFGGVRLTWHRQVSPPPDTATFADVAPDDFGFQQIEALVASGITGGCGNGNYCPNATVTRAQMAIFLAKALGLHWPYGGGF
jgi:hypothetical protein